MKTSLALSAVTLAVVGWSAAVASAQPQPPVERLPPGFKVVTKNAGPALVSMEALIPPGLPKR